MNTCPEAQLLYDPERTDRRYITLAAAQQAVAEAVALIPPLQEERLKPDGQVQVVIYHYGAEAAALRASLIPEAQ